MSERPVELTIEDLAERVNVPVRTVRFYIAEGLLPGPGARGKAASYGEEHLLRLLLIRRLVAGHMPLREVGERASNLSVEEVRALLAREVRREEDLRRAATAPSPRAYLEGLLEQARAASMGKTPSAGPRAPAPTPDARFSGGATWQRWETAPGVEVHVREDVATAYGKRIERALAELRRTLNQSAE